MRITRPVAFAADLVLVAAFATLGRLAHHEGLGAAETWNTVWPFLVGVAVAWGSVLAARRPAAAVPTGVQVWLVTLLGGMAVRAVHEGKIPHWSFLVFAGIVTALFLVGWRAVARALARRRPS